MRKAPVDLQWRGDAVPPRLDRVLAIGDGEVCQGGVDTLSVTASPGTPPGTPPGKGLVGGKGQQ